MDFESLLAQLTEVLSGVRAKSHVAEIVRHHRIQASPEFDDAIACVRDTLGRIGVEATVSSFPADGRTETYGWTAPIAWRIRSGSLRQVEPDGHPLCSYDDVAISILGQSGPGRGEGELVHIGKGTTAKDVEGVDLEGRFVLACGRAMEVARRIRGSGAAALVIYPDSERAAASYDLVQYGGLFPKANEVETTPMGFSISRREADRMIAQLAKGPVRLAGEVDAEFFDGSMQVLEAELPGTDPGAGAILLVAHLCHPRPSANDNASGSGLLIEVAWALREIASKQPLKNAVRFLWVPEFNGAVPWAAANVERLRDVRLVVNLDMVGESPELLGEPLRVFRVPNARPTFLNACVEPILSRIAGDPITLSPQGSRRPLHWILDGPSGGSDHLVFQAAPHALPAVMFGHDDPFWHTDLDTFDKVDPTRLKHVGLLTALVAALPTWGPTEAARIGGWLLPFSARELARAAAFAQRTEPTRGRAFLAAALAIETARADSMRAVVGDNAWDAQRHVELLASIERTLSEPFPAAESPGGPAPRRALDGPVRYEIVDELTEKERAFFDDKFSAGHRAAVESLVNLCDGSRTIDEIAVHLTLDFDQRFSLADVERAVKLLAKVGYLAV